MSILDRVSDLAMSLMAKEFRIKDIYGEIHHVSVSDIGYTFKFDNAKQRFGCCNYTKQVISLSRHMCEANPNQLDGKIKDTILHEMAHAISRHIYGRDGMGHGRKWREISLSIGADGNRCYSMDSYGGLNAPQSKYTLSCPSCDRQTPMHRKPKRGYACGVCCTNGYDPKFKMVLVQNY